MNLLWLLDVRLYYIRSPPSLDSYVLPSCHVVTLALDTRLFKSIAICLYQSSVPNSTSAATFGRPGLWTLRALVLNGIEFCIQSECCFMNDMEIDRKVDKNRTIERLRRKWVALLLWCGVPICGRCQCVVYWRDFVWSRPSSKCRVRVRTVR